MAAQTCVLHGGWLPDGERSHFVIWAERPPGQGRPDRALHPFQLNSKELSETVSSLRSGLVDVSPGSPVWAVLPSCSTGPSPSLELQSAAGLQDMAPTQWRAWKIDVLKVMNPIALSGFVDEIATLPSFTIGSDLQYWARLAARLADAIRRHEYLPAVFARPGTRGKSRRGRKTAGVAFDPGWELTDTALDSLVDAFAGAMPGICRSLWEAQPQVGDASIPLRDAAGLIRHFVSVELHRQIWRTRFPATVCKRLRQAFPGESLLCGSNGENAVTETHWRQWQRWRDLINRSAVDADERICFRLLDAGERSPDSWRLEWLLAPRKDPSLLIPLEDFWKSSRRARSVREVLLQLGQAARLYARLWDGMESERPASIELDREEALQFLRNDAPILQGAGFRVIVPSWWTASGQRRLRLRIRARYQAGGEEGAGTESSGLLGMDAVVDWSPHVVIDGEPLTVEEWNRIVAAKEGLVFMRGEWMELSADEVADLESYWQSDAEDRSMTFGEFMRTRADQGVEIACEGALEDALAALCTSDALGVQEQPAGFEGTLRSYQRRGFSWLVYLEKLGLGACLADDMGLGKTIQVLAAIVHDRPNSSRGGPTLLVAPTSVLGNWLREARRFAPALKVVIHHGSDRPKTTEELKSVTAAVDLVIVSFGVARLDLEILKNVAWRRLVVDEAQNVKNPNAAVTKALRGIRADRRVALTGTPVENRLLDLWSLFSVLNPGFLGTASEFRKGFEQPIMKDGNRTRLEQLREMVRPFILRRLKTDRSIIGDLPAKVEQNAFCNLTTEQATLYEAVLRDVESKLDESDGVQRRGLMLATLMRLKQICNHPAQFLQDGSEFTARRSHKLARVCEMLDEINAEGESALLFTQFTEVGRLLEALLRALGDRSVYYLHGGTPSALRGRMVEQFQDDDSEPAVFVLSLRAAGVGLTLTRANHVIHFDRWWNPAVENQATDRAYRIGQTRMVMVHKMVTMGTLEERIDALIESKKKLVDDIIGTDESWLSDMGNDAFRELISLDRGQAVVG